MARVVSSPTFVGRVKELGRLEAALAAAGEGRSGVLVIGGEAGVGKTRLVEEFLSLAPAQGAVGLVGGCLDVEEGRLPFGPFVEALRPHLRGLDPGARADLLAPGAEELARLLPELSSGLAGEPPEVSASAQGRLFELVLGLLGRLAEGAPLVVVLEDLHWSDRSTRDLLQFLMRNLRTEPVLIVATFRSDELHRGHPLRAFLAELERNRRLDHIDLHPFNSAELAAQLAGILGNQAEPALVDSIFERSQGNAFFAEELLATGQPRELPPTVQDIMLTRIERLSPAAQQVLGAVAAGGRLVSDGLLASVSSLADDDRVAALREAVAYQLLVADGSAYAFRHELLREAAYQELLPEERARLHAGYGQALDERPELACDPETVIGDLAHHWYAAHDLPRAFAAAVGAGAAAERRYGFGDARTHYERALELWAHVPDAGARVSLDHVALARRAAEAANLAGDHGRAAALIQVASGHVNSGREPALAGILRERLGRYLWAAGDSEAALRAYDEAVRLVPREPPSPARARVLAARGQGLMLLGRHQESSACCEESIAIARTVGARAEEGHALNTLGCDLAYLGDPDAAVANLQEALQIAEEVGDLDDLCRAYLNLSDFLAGPLNRLEEALELALEGIERSQRVGMAGDYGVSLQSNAATALLALGRFEEAAGILLAADRRTPSEMAAIDLHQCRAHLDVWRGAFDAAALHLAAARELMVSTIDPPYHAPLRAIEAELALWQRSPSVAREAVAAGLGALDGGDDRWLGAPLLWLGLWAEADVAAPSTSRRGHEESVRAEDAGAVLLARARALLHGPAFVPVATRAYVSLCEAEADRLAATADPQPWERAADAWESLGHPYPEAYARWRLAEVLLARRRSREGAETLGRAHAIALRIGADHLVHEIVMLAHRGRIAFPSPPTAVAAAGEPASTGDETGLTPRQLEVLGLLAVGRTNREIAETLFITEKTAGAHVSSILSKLGVRSRVEAATTAYRTGLVSAPER